MTSKPPFYVQEHGYSCALACLRMILGHFNKAVPEESELVEAAHLEGKGLFITDLAGLAEKYGLGAEIVELNSAGIYRFVSEGKLPIVFIERKPLDGEDSFHALIPYRVTERFVFCLDPHPRFRAKQGVHRITKRLFKEAQHRIAYCVICKPK